jgi:hypothetical protein
MSDDTAHRKKMLEFFNTYSINTGFEIVPHPPKINQDTFEKIIQTFHSRDRSAQRVDISPEQIQFFKDALATDINRCCFDISNKMFEIDIEGQQFGYRFSKDLKHFIKNREPLKDSEKRNRYSYDYQEAYDDAILAEAVLKRDMRPFPSDFVKQITMNRTCFTTDKKTLVIIPKDSKKPCWQFIFNADWTILITLYTAPKFRKYLDEFNKGEYKKIQPIRVPNKQFVPIEWLPQELQPQIKVEEKKRIICPKCNMEFEKAGQLTTHKQKEHKQKYFSVDEMYKQKYLKYKSKYLKMKEFLQ